jgi:glutathione S-transferase
MRCRLFPPSSRVTAILALKHQLSLDWESALVDLGRGDQRNPNYRDLNPNLKMSTLEDDDFVLWESNAKPLQDGPQSSARPRVSGSS